MTLRLEHIELATHDPARLARSYAAAGLAVSEQQGKVVLDGGRGTIVLHPSGEAPLSSRLRACDPGIAHVCLQSVSPDATWVELAAEGMAWNAPLLGLGTGYTYAYGYDVEGNLVELEGTSERLGDRETWLAHAAIVTPDIDRASAFYTDLIGVAPHASGQFRHPNMGRIAALADVEARGTWIATEALALELWHYVTPPTGPRTAERPTGFRRLGFVADDLPHDVERIRAAGIAVRVGPAGELLGEDPDGNAFRILAAG